MLATVQAAVKAGADLAGADLAGAYLAHANLAHANLARADLASAYLAHADLAHANLARAKINWTSHDLLSELLRRAAGNDLQKRSLAGLPLVSRDWCWNQFIALQLPEELRAWAIDTLRPFVREGDGAPEILRTKGDE